VKANWKGKRVTVMGLGLFSGGVGAVRYFAREGARVLVTDLRTGVALAESVAKVKGPNVSFRLGAHRAKDFTDTDLVVANPGVPVDNRFLKAARRAGVPVDAEMNLFFKNCPAPIVGVTGSNGKSTTAALIAHILRAAGRTCHFGGNIGRSLLATVGRIRPADVVVLEISSFQLEYLRLDGLSPHIAVVLNVQPNHLDRHKTMGRYAAAKRHIVEHQGKGDFAVLNADDRRVRAMARATRAKRLFFSSRGTVRQGAWLDGDVVSYRLGRRRGVIRQLDRMKLIGLHNRENVCAAVAVSVALGVKPQVIEKAVRTFRPLPHRFEKVAVRRGVTYINDSIATNPNSVAAALRCFHGNVLLIAGGSPKDIPYDPMIKSVVKKVKLLLLIGRTAPEIEAGVRAVSRVKPEIVHARTLERALKIARKRAVPGDAVLLSPACASFDQFRNFEERGERFRRLVRLALPPTR
jgi:UDP-N-acetylmuramoylalanine--D-glutamate ligase